MKRDPRIIVFGEDVADASRERACWPRTKGKGGRCSASTWGLQKLYGGKRRPQLAARRGQHRRARAIGLATLGLSARWSRSSSSTIHLAGHDADPERAVEPALAFRTTRSALGCLHPVPQVWLAWRGRRQGGGAPITATVRRGKVFRPLSWGSRIVLPEQRHSSDGRERPLWARKALRCEDPVLSLWERKHLVPPAVCVKSPPYPGPDFHGAGSASRAWCCVAGRDAGDGGCALLVQRACISRRPGDR
mgnify:CR=1 FL=1